MQAPAAVAKPDPTGREHRWRGEGPQYPLIGSLPAPITARPKTCSHSAVLTFWDCLLSREVWTSGQVIRIYQRNPSLSCRRSLGPHMLLHCLILTGVFTHEALQQQTHTLLHVQNPQRLISVLPTPSSVWAQEQADKSCSCVTLRKLADE